MNPEKTEVIVEHDDYATIKIRYDLEKKGNKVGNNPLLGAENLLERSCNGRIVETYMHDGTVVEGFCQDYGKEEIYTHIIKGFDGSAIKVTEKGEVVIISAKDRLELAQPLKPNSKEKIDKEWLKP
jgi:hypothetical protein